MRPQQEAQALFLGKACNVEELKCPYAGRYESCYVVEKIVELSEADFHKFSRELYGYYRFLYDNKDSMYCDENRMHCLLVTTKERCSGILVEAEGYAYARYSAYVPDCRQLDLGGVEVVDHVDLSEELPQEYWKPMTREDINKIVKRGRER